jgi:zinc transporter, ZIP family
MALATGLGALPFAFVGDLTRKWLGASNAVAGDLMLAASFGLIYEGVSYGLARRVLGALIGLAFIVLTRNLLRGKEHHLASAEARGVGSRKALLMVGVMTAHSFTEGVGVGVSFGRGQDLEIFISLAIAVHSVPEGLAISLVLIPRGPAWARRLSGAFFRACRSPS